MDIPTGQGYRRHPDAAGRPLDSARVIAARYHGFALSFDPIPFGGLQNILVQSRVIQGLFIHKRDNGAAADPADLLVRSHPSRIGRRSGVHHHRDVWTKLKRRRSGSTQPDFLLNRTGQRNVLFLDAACQLQQQCAAGPIVQGTRFDEPALQPDKLAVKYRHISRMRQLFSLLPAVRTDVDE